MPPPAERHDGAMPDRQLVRALDHPLRVSILRLLAERGRISAPEARSRLNRPEVALSNTAYQAWVLEHLGLIETTGEADPNGSPVFQATPSGEAVLAALGLSGWC